MGPLPFRHVRGQEEGFGAGGHQERGEGDYDNCIPDAQVGPCTHCALCCTVVGAYGALWLLPVPCCARHAPPPPPPPYSRHLLAVARTAQVPEVRCDPGAARHMPCSSLPPPPLPLSCYVQRDGGRGVPPPLAPSLISPCPPPLPTVLPLLCRGMADEVLSIPWHLCIFDEAHTLKNSKTQAGGGVGGWAGAAVGRAAGPQPAALRRAFPTRRSLCPSAPFRTGGPTSLLSCLPADLPGGQPAAHPPAVRPHGHPISERLLRWAWHV